VPSCDSWRVCKCTDMLDLDALAYPSSSIRFGRHRARRDISSCVRGAACFSCMYTLALHPHTQSTEDRQVLRMSRTNRNGDEYQLGKTYGALVRNSAVQLSASTRAFMTLNSTCHQLRRPALPPSAGPWARSTRRKLRGHPALHFLSNINQTTRTYVHVRTML
jgi:hypothetical protein